ncbi:glycosyltransferase family 39 protein [Desulforhabdus amnigena]|uniref:glycosyltransferase family 39 protein n=1 Tax=Desulforhabdus amnigena TaxID=40218 RepID=UPI002491671A|nr:glycosyltransferase family 39 protein [Desulforhabdus amnigena]
MTILQRYFSKLNNLILLIVVLAFLFRIWGIWNVDTTDEYNEVLEALRVCSGHLNYERWIKRFYCYILAFEYGIFYLVGWLAGTFSSPLEFATKIVRDMQPLFLLGRLTSVLAGTLSIVTLFRIGEKFFDRTTALTASILLTFTVFHIDLSQQAKVDALLGLLVTISLFFIIKLSAAEAIHSRDLAYCAFFTALAIQTKPNSIALVAPLCLLFVTKFQILRKNLASYTLIFTLFFVAGLIIGNPPILFAPHKFASALFNLSSVYTTAVNLKHCAKSSRLPTKPQWVSFWRRARV